ncbi:NB-ARC domain-containing protein [Streptomyces noboritoensis]|uniref:NB-ARC domain-containing protein n=1 Tax=Streptomyces noboritoensis TaxID=67337 RepID=A0ABV6TSA7_9ACTN
MLGNLPAETTSFVGRSVELATLDGLLRNHRLVTVTGPGGVGKSRLALRGARGRDAFCPDGVWWVELSPLCDPELLAATVADHLGVTDQTTRTAAEALCGWLGDKRLLLVLDTCEHLVSACGHLIGELLQTSPGLTVLATSRQSLGRPEERVFSLGPLPPEGAALTLFKQRAVDAVPHLTLKSFETPARADAAAAVCRRLDGIPLALELAGARLRLWSVEQLAERLDSRFEVLADTRAARLPRHQTMRTTIGWSHELCAPLERLLWARLSVFAGAFDLEAAQEVAAGGPLAPEAVGPALTGLVAKSVVRARTHRGRAGYRMLDTIREYGRQWLGELGEEAAVARRHAERCRRLARAAEAEWMGPDQVDWYERLAAGHADLRTALDHLLATDPEAALDMASSLWFFWFCCGHLREGRGFLERALALDPAPGPRRDRAEWALGMTAFLQGDMETALGHGRRCAASAADPESRLRAAYLLGGAILMPGDAEGALDVCTPAIDAADDDLSPGLALCALARIYALTNLGRYREAAAEATWLRDQCASRGERWMRAYADYMLAVTALALGRATEAAEHVRAMLTGKQLLHDSFGIAIGLDLLACALAARGDGEEGALVLGIGQEYWRTVGKAQMGAPRLTAVREECERRARAAVGDQAYDSAFRRGARAGLDQGLSYALKGDFAQGS